ncbi:MAG: hypothetical protein JWR18_631 [Segetibacter sp.]|jgi:predicted PurR-regulated permease PerM|nr:hypothetical protein [Segetibacter sp.]
MKFLIAFILTALLSFAGCLFFPWWIIALAAFIVALVISQTPFKSFLSAFAALFVLWFVQSFLIDNRNDHLLATKVASILSLGGSPLAVIILSSLIGGLVAGMAALTASFARGRRSVEVVN